MMSFLASLGFSHPWMPMVLYTFLGSLLTSVSLSRHPRPVGEAALLILLGVFAWTLIEYGLHRFLFHWNTMKEPFKSWVVQAHLEHHRTAKTGEGILVRPFFTLITALIVYFLLAALSLSWNKALLLETGVFLGYIAYEWVHFAAHRFHPSSGLGRYLQRYHLHHHFKETDHAFGVTTPFWDWTFRSGPSRPLL
jgi:dihydroceramide fatty acyl 2-hydroxylase